MTPLTVTILAKNEDKLIERCISSVLWADEILLLDSGSTDRTKEIAKSLGAIVYEQEWLGWTEQHNRAIELAKHDWVLVLDCDEIVTQELAQSIMQVMGSSPNDCNGYAINRRGDFYDTLLPNFSSKRKKLDLVRLFNRKRSGFDPDLKVHEEVRVPGKRILLRGDLIHWRGRLMDEYITAFNQYASLEAEALNHKQHRASAINIILRPILRFIWCYIIHQEFRFGTKGLIHSILMATSEYIRYAKLWELQNTKRFVHPPFEIQKAHSTKIEACRYSTVSGDS